MLISVVIPAYNCISSLESTLDSILLSGLKDYEILLIDDGSGDGTSDLCDELQNRHVCVRCIHQENGGVSQARNRGIQEAQGEYILFFDADDSVDPEALRDCEEILLRQHPDMLIFGMSFDYYFHGKIYRRDEMISPLEGLLTKNQWSSEMGALYGCNALSPVWNKFICKNLLEKHQILFPGGMIEMEDFLFTVRCMRYCQEVFFLPKAIYRYRQTEDESNTFRRLCRIPSISAYMQPFETELTVIDGQGDIAERIYESFFYEMIRYADLSRLEQTAKDMQNGKYAAYIAAKDPVLYRRLAGEKYRLVWLKSWVGRVRHWIAVRIKFLRNGGGRV